MAQLFISYSRVDKDFVAKLRESLERAGYSVWVDWEGIPATSYFLEEILPAIDEAAGFLTVISPDYVKSVTCRMELDHALKNSKRLIPIMFRAVERAAIPNPLGDIHWTFFDEPSKFEERLPSLIRTINTDLEWTKEHAQLLVRARAWETRLRRSSLLLRGRDLLEAESWLTKKHSGVEQPTELHFDYIHKSRSNAKLWRRIRLVGLQVALVFAVLGWMLYGRYESGQRLQRAQSLARSSARELSEMGGTRLSALLACESLKLYPTADGNSALCAALAAHPVRISTIDGGKLFETDFCISGDGEVVGISSGEQVQFYHAASGARLGSSNEGASLVSLNHDGSVYACFQSGMISIGQTTAPFPLARIALDQEPLDLFLDGNGDRVAVVTQNNMLVQFSIDRETWKSARIRGVPRVSSYQFSAQAKVQAYVQDDTDVIVEHENGNRVRMAHDSRVTQLDLAANGRLLTSTDRQSIYVWDMHTGKLISFVAEAEPANRLLQSSDPNYCWNVTKSGEFVTMDLSDGSVIARSWLIDPPDEIDVLGVRQIMAFSTQGDRIEFARQASRIVVKESQLFYMYQLPQNDFQGVKRLSDEPYAEISFAPNHEQFAANCMKNGYTSVDVFNSHSGELQQRIPCSAFAIGAAISPDLQRVALALENGDIEIHEVGKTGASQRLQSDWAASALYFETPHRLLTACIDQRARIWDLKQPAVVKEFSIASDVRSLNSRISHDGRWLLTGTENVAAVYDWQTGQSVGRFTTNSLAILAVAISGAGQRVALADRNMNATIFDTSTGSRKATFHFERQFMEIALNENGRQFAVLDKSGMLTIWDTDTSVLTAQRDLSDWSRSGVFTEMEFDASGDYLLIAGLAGLYKLGPLSNATLSQFASNQLPCSWSLLEWNQYFKNSPFDPSVIAPPLFEEFQAAKPR